MAEISEMILKPNRNLLRGNGRRMSIEELLFILVVSFFIQNTPYIANCDRKDKFKCQ